MNSWPHDDEPQTNNMVWMLTYSDLMTLLLAFFVLWFSFSEIKKDKRFHSLIGALRKQFSAKEHSLFGLGKNGVFDPLAEAKEDPASHKIIERKNNFILGSLLYFESAECKLTSEQKQVVIAWAQDVCDAQKLQIEIRAHLNEADGFSAKKTPQPWQTAYARCLEVRDFLVKLGVRSECIQIGVSLAPATDEIVADREVVSLWREPERVTYKPAGGSRKR